MLELQIRDRRRDDELERAIGEKALAKGNDAGLEAHRTSKGLSARASRSIANAWCTFAP